MKSTDLSKESSFLLTKWYLDCVAESGDAAVAYVANLCWNKLPMYYASLFTVLEDRVHSASSLRKGSFPRLDRDTTTLSLGHLGIEGTWRALRAPVERTVFERQHGSVVWRCHQPMARVDLILHGKTRIMGLGYVECLTPSVLPWKLPLEELHWGRFLSEQDALVWIDWRGPHQWWTVLHNGEEREVQSVTESEMISANPGMRLDLDRGIVLRSGQLGQNVLAGVSRLATLLPHTMLSVDECKWRSRAVLQTGNAATSGWANPRGGQMEMRKSAVGKLLYGALFTLALPILLVVWAIKTHGLVHLPAIQSLPLGMGAVGVGVLLVALRMASLRFVGGGLPMNAFPPPRYVSSGIYGLFSHPIYLGFSLACVGAAIAAGSAGGLWLVSTTVFLASVGLVLGYELPDMQARFGQGERLLPADDQVCAVRDGVHSLLSDRNYCPGS